jgi:ribosomal protein S27AE
METKKCSKCGNVKKMSDFVIKKSNKSGVAAFCKSCGNAWHLAHRKQRLVTDPKYKSQLALMHAKSGRTSTHKYNEYRTNARNRGHYFDLTLEQFMLFWQKPCSHCGSSIEVI